MPVEVFVDTNVLLYAHDTSAGVRHHIARQRVADLWASGTGALSTQVLQELYVNLTRKLPRPLRRSDARQLVADYATWNVVTIGPADVLDAVDLEGRHRLSFWDSLIVRAAVSSGAATLLTEDVQHGRTIAGLRIENPFA